MYAKHKMIIPNCFGIGFYNEFLSLIYTVAFILISGIQYSLYETKQSAYKFHLYSKYAIKTYNLRITINP